MDVVVLLDLMRMLLASHEHLPSLQVALGRLVLMVGVLTLLGVAPILPPFRGPSSAKRYAKLTQNGV
jgi:hypothetical protein